MEDKEYLEEAKERKEEDRAVSEEAEKKPAKDDDEYEKICYVCRRPESKTGPMVTMGGMNLCHDCMQKAFDSVTQGGFDLSKIQNMPYMNLNLSDFSNLNQQNVEIPKKQKIKKRTAETKKPEFDLKDIPAPHIIKQRLDEYVIGQEQAMKKETGARALRSIIEDFMLDIMYEIPKDPEIGSVVITRAYLDKNGGPLIQMRGYH